MKKLILPIALVLSACSAVSADDNKVAECSRIMGRIVEQPTTQQNLGNNFLGKYHQNTNADANRELARKAGCIK